MPNTFLQVNKDLFKLGLNPTQILIMAQIMEYERTTDICFISNAKLAELFGVSESTIKREIAKLEEKGYLIRDTKQIKGGSERKLHTNLQGSK